MLLKKLKQIVYKNNLLQNLKDMRQFFVFILFYSLLSNICNAQQPGFEYIKSSDHDIVPLQMIELDDSFLFSMFSHELRCNENGFNGVLRLDKDGLFLEEKIYCNDSLALAVSDFHIINQSIRLIGLGYNADSGKCYLWHATLDADLNIEQESFIYLADYNIGILSSKVVGDKIICTGWLNSALPPIPFVVGLTLDGNVLFNKSDFDFFDLTTRLFYNEEEDTYVLSGRRIRRYDNQFNLLESQGTLFFQGELMELSDSTWLKTGISTTLSSSDLGIGILGDDFLLTDSIIIGNSIVDDYPAFYQSIATIDHETFFVGGTLDFQVSPSLHQSTPSWFKLISMDGELNINWEESYGGDAYYVMYGVKATSDGGCIMYGLRHDFENDPGVLQLYILKVDENGIVTSTTSIPYSNTAVFNIFPNPTQDVLSLELLDEQNNECTIISIFDAASRLVFKTECYNESLIELDVKNFPSGTYFVNINDNDGDLLGVQKFVKQ